MPALAVTGVNRIGRLRNNAVPIFEIKPLPKTGGIALCILDSGEPAAFIYTEPENNAKAFDELLDAGEALASKSVKVTAFVWVKSFSEPIKFRPRGAHIVMNVGRRKGADGQLEDFSVKFDDFLRDFFSAIRYGLNLLLPAGPDGTIPDWIKNVAAKYNRVAAEAGQPLYENKKLGGNPSI